jgi:hypothetical protein
VAGSGSGCQCFLNGANRSSIERDKDDNVAMWFVGSVAGSGRVTVAVWLAVAVDASAF